MNFDIFHAYDIRGIYPTEINEETAYKISLGYAAMFKPKTVAVGSKHIEMILNLPRIV